MAADKDGLSADDNKEGYTATRREQGRQNAWIHRAASGPDPKRDSNNVADDKVKVVKRPTEIERTREKPYG
ncbi:MAG: hypothetical protein M3516_03425 [Actinomycetota bacterium]|nr:hypothetical protein [Actinomycetota bacterium]